MRKFELEEQRVWRGWGGGADHEVGGCLVVEGFVSEEEYFEVNLLRDEESVEDGGDVVMGVGEQMISVVLDVLEFTDEFG